MSLIYFVRHGESIGNTQLKNLTPDENVLSETGVVQAKKLGAHLENVVFTHVFSSPYIRAISTTQHILSESKTLYSDDVIVVDSDIRERYLGIYEQKCTKELAHAFKSTGVDFDWTPEGGETKQEVELRLESFLQKVGNIVDTGSERNTILVVTHAALMIHLWCYLLERNEKYRLKNWKSDFLKVSKNANYFLLAVEKLEGAAQPREFEVKVAHDSEHLVSQKDAFSGLAKDKIKGPKSTITLAVGKNVAAFEERFQRLLSFQSKIIWSRVFLFSVVNLVGLYGLWVLIREKGREINFARFHQRYYLPLGIVLAFVAPTAIPWMFWDELITVALSVTFCNYVLSLHRSSLVNSAAYMWGNKPDDKSIQPAENCRTTAAIELFAALGMAYDLRTVGDNVVESRALRTGDGSRKIRIRNN
ncbi:unnamed protein product [Allacma fusca]|uniref:Phosphoglycerate mutase n=1 Tax=Allacma fusca TaxID=39272 RepID=A0A8J2KKU8_9HEXA|nr:unnamed protein product [Allacma fusca]